MRRAPPERFHVFVSYTTREDEVRLIKPIVDHFLNDVLRPIIESTVGEPPVFYDGYYLYSLRGIRLPDALLRTALRFAIEESEVLLAFVSPEYMRSPWCLFECRVIATKQPRPWFDVCRTPPIDELRDQRRRGVRPSPWDCILASWLRLLSKGRETTPAPAEQLVPIVWKGAVDSVMDVPDLAACRVFDWTSCIRAAEASERVVSHVAHHGSVSPTWVAEAETESGACEKEMTETALLVARILRRRRQTYQQRNVAEIAASG